MTPPLTKSSATDKTPLLANEATQQTDPATLLTVRFGSPDETWFGYVSRRGEQSWVDEVVSCRVLCD